MAIDQPQYTRLVPQIPRAPSRSLDFLKGFAIAFLADAIGSILLQLPGAGVVSTIAMFVSILLFVKRRPYVAFGVLAAITLTLLLVGGLAIALSIMVMNRLGS